MRLGHYITLHFSYSQVLAVVDLAAVTDCAVVLLLYLCLIDSLRRSVDVIAVDLTDDDGSTLRSVLLRLCPVKK